MLKLKEFYDDHKKYVTLASLFIIIISVTCISFLGLYKRYNISEIKQDIVAVATQKNSSIEDDMYTIEEERKDIIYVDVKGFVANEGVYSLESGARVIDAINAAGGLVDSAYTRYLNLSKKLRDEDVIIVNSMQEIEDIKDRKNKEIFCEETNEACADKESVITNDFKEDKKNDQSELDENKKDSSDDVNIFVNINTASLEELMKLVGIGESKALNIIKYREENGDFQNIDDIMNVSGIGESVYEKIKNNITVW